MPTGIVVVINQYSTVYIYAYICAIARAMQYFIQTGILHLNASTHICIYIYM